MTDQTPPRRFRVRIKTLLVAVVVIALLAAVYIGFERMRAAKTRRRDSGFEISRRSTSRWEHYIERPSTAYRMITLSAA